MRRVIATLLLASLAACGSAEGIRDARGELVLESQVVEFPRTFVGYPTTANLLVDNTGLVPLPLVAEPPPPFSVEKSPVQVPAGGDRPIPIRFDPPEPGRFQARMRVVLDGGDEYEVLLVGNAEPAPPCSDSPCRKATFHPDTGKCELAVMPDLSPCESGNGCMENELCRSGECVGTQKSCDDGSVCTTDACDPGTGCVHLEISCPGSGNPCQEPICHPTLGCGLGAVDDGTLCGPADCVTANICLSGACSEVDTPDGTPCNAKCGEGKCEAGECERPEGRVLKSHGSYQPPDGRRMTWSGLTDGAGMLYWVECGSAGPCELVSATSEGIPRWPEKAPLAFANDPAPRGMALADGLVIVAGNDQTVVEAHLPADGSSPWRVNLAGAIDEAIDDCPCTAEDGVLTTGPEGRILFSAQLRGALPSQTHVFLGLLRTANGEAVWSLELPDSTLAAPPMADEEGNFFVALAHGDGSGELLSLAPDRSERWRIPTDGGVPLAVTEGRILDELGGLRGTDDGSSLFALSLGDEIVAPPLVGRNVGYVFTAGENGNRYLEPFDPATGAGPTRVPVIDPALLPVAVTPAFTDPVLTLKDGALFTVGLPGETGLVVTELVEFDEEGALRRRCTVPGTSRYFGAISLKSGRFAAKNAEGLRIFKLPPSAGDLATTGWVTPAGGPAAGGKPR